MKRKISLGLVFILMMTILFSACGSNNLLESPSESASYVDDWLYSIAETEKRHFYDMSTEDIAEVLMDTVQMRKPMRIQQSQMQMNYDIEIDMIEEFSVYRSAETSSITEVAIFRVKEKSYVPELMEVLDARAISRIKTLEAIRETEYKLDNWRVLISKDNLAILVISSRVNDVRATLSSIGLKYRYK